MDGTDSQCEQALELLEKVSRDLYSTDLGAPGLAIRMDRLERQIQAGVRVMRWVGSGGLVGFAGTLYLLTMVLDAVRKAGGL